MKRTGIVCLLTLAATAAIPAGAAELRLGPLAGANAATISVTNPEPWNAYGTKTRPIFGAIAELRLGPSLSLAVEPAFVGKGFTLTESDETMRADLDYVEVPLYAKYRLTRGSVRPYVGGGAFLGFLRRAEMDGADFKDEVKDTDAGLAFGGGIELVSGSATLFLDGRYALGLTNISASLDDTDSEARNRGLQVRAGVTFRLGS
jgi:hypothetical protein